MSSACFEPKGLSSGRWFYIVMGCYILHAEIKIKGFYKISKYEIFGLLNILI